MKAKVHIVCSFSAEIDVPDGWEDWELEDKLSNAIDRDCYLDVRAEILEDYLGVENVIVKAVIVDEQ